MATDSDSTPGGHVQSLIEPSVEHFIAGVTAISALRMLARRYGKPVGGGSFAVPKEYAWDLAVEAIRQWEAVNKRRPDADPAV